MSQYQLENYKEFSQTLGIIFHRVLRSTVILKTNVSCSFTEIHPINEEIGTFLNCPENLGLSLIQLAEVFYRLIYQVSYFSQFYFHLLYVQITSYKGICNV